MLRARSLRSRVIVTTLVGLLGLAAVGACRTPTEITIEITTDVKCADVRGTAITVGALADLDGKPSTTVTTACDPRNGRIGSMVIVPSGAKDDIVAIKVVLGIGKDPAECAPPAYGPGCVIARRALHFIPSAALTVPIFMGTVCSGIPCDATQTCIGGNCASATIDDSSKCLEPGGCGESALGPTTPADAGIGGKPDGGSGSTDAGELPVPMDPIAACGRPSTYVDDFTDGVIAPEWVSVASAGSSVAETGGRLAITSAAGGNARLESRFTVNLAGDRMRVEVPVAPTTGTSAVLAARAVNGDELAFVARDGVLAMHNSSGALDETKITYDPVAHRWWQIVEAAGQVRWETSPDATTWTPRKMIATPAFAPAVQLVLESVSSGAAGVARFDRVNAGRPRAPWCKASTLVDDFSGSAPGLAWIPTVQGACSYVETGGEVRFTMTGVGPTSFCAYGSSSAYDLRASAAYLEIPAITTFFPPVHFFLRVMDASGHMAAIRFVGSAAPQLEENADGLGAQATSYSASTEGWWRLREAGGTLFWETSADGTTWVVKRQAAPPFSLDAVRLLVGVETNATMPGSINIGTPRFNAGP